jgi:hypothetical protein
MMPADSFPLATVLTAPLEVIGVWLASIAWHSGLAAAWALLTGHTPNEVGQQAAAGAGAGFILGIPLTICATILVIGGG